jgi:hypothetical protein
MEFLDTNLTKDSSLLLHAIHSPFYRRILNKTIPFSAFNNPYKNPPNKKTHSVERKNEGRKTRRKLSLLKSLCPKTTTINAVQELDPWCWGEAGAATSWELRARWVSPCTSWITSPCLMLSMGSCMDGNIPIKVKRHDPTSSVADPDPLVRGMDPDPSIIKQK